MAPGADLRTDLPRYRVWRDGKARRGTDVTRYWRDDLVAFLIGCSFTFENALLQAGVPVRHVEQGRNVPMYRTSIECRPAGRFSGPLVVSMRPMRPAQAIRATQITSRYGPVHGAPVHIGDPAAIGIEDIGAPDFGDPVEIRGRGPGVLGLRRDAASGRGQAAAGADDHPRAGAHVLDGRATTTARRSGPQLRLKQPPSTLPLVSVAITYLQTTSRGRPLEHQALIVGGVPRGNPSSATAAGGVAALVLAV